MCVLRWEEIKRAKAEAACGFILISTCSDATPCGRIAMKWLRWCRCWDGSSYGGGECSAGARQVTEEVLQACSWPGQFFVHCSGVAAPRCCCQCWCWLLVRRDCTLALGHHLWDSDHSYFLVSSLPDLYQPWVSPRNCGQELGCPPAQSFCRRCQHRVPKAPQKNGKRGRRDREDTGQEWM